MKVLLVAHGYPPEFAGGTESTVQSLARGLAERGLDVVVVAGSIDHGPEFRTSEDADGPIRVIRLHRADLYFDHWQKSASATVGEAFAEVLRAERPDVAHVHHWIRLTRDLVAIAAREGVPAAVTLHDFWSTCLITFRVRPDTKDACDAPLGPAPCLACAQLVPPRTPWVSRENQTMALLQHKGDLARELRLARAVLAPSAAHAGAVAGFLGLDEQELAVRVVPHGRDLALERREPPPRGDGPLVLGAWGNLFPLKGFDLVLEAIARLPDPSRVQLHVAGAETSDEHTARLFELARGLDVTFHGAYDVAELASHPVSAVHAMVSGTRARETWGLVVDEAVALGIPMVLPRAGAFPERLREGEGVLFYEPRDVESLAARLQQLVDDPALAPSLRERLPALADVCPTVADHVARVTAVYEDVAAAGAPEAPARNWWELKLLRAQEEDWDRRLATTPAEELGFA